MCCLISHSRGCLHFDIRRFHHWPWRKPSILYSHPWWIVSPSALNHFDLISSLFMCQNLNMLMHFDIISGEGMKSYQAWKKRNVCVLLSDDNLAILNPAADTLRTNFGIGDGGPFHCKHCIFVSLKDRIHQGKGTNIRMSHLRLLPHSYGSVSYNKHSVNNLCMRCIIQFSSVFQFST